MGDNDGVDGALNLISQFGGIDGAHHKQWVLDQVVRALTGDGDTITSRAVSTHTLKTLPPWFGAVISGEKTCEVRINDRDFRVGDWLRLVEWEPSIAMAAGGRETGRECWVRVTHIVHGGKFGIDRHHVVMSVRREGT